MRSTHQNFKFDIRFVDTDTDDSSDHPWRMRFVIDNTVVEWDGTWQHIQVPLTDFTEQGAWDDTTWYNPQSLFDWSSVEYFEIAADYHDLKTIELFFDDIKITDNSTGISMTDNIPVKFSMDQNYPNPFNPATKIKFSIAKGSYTTLKISDILGREIDILLSEYLKAGEYTLDWNGNNIPSGVYFYSLQTDDFSQTKKLLLLK